MSARVFRLAHLVEPPPQTDCASLAEASLAAFSLNLAREQLGLPALTHVVEYEDGRRVAVWPLDRAGGPGS